MPEEMAPQRAAMHTLLERGGPLPSGTLRAFCNDGGKLAPALWPFVTGEGGEPTNNVAERALRPAVLWRKGCFGADRTQGNPFVAKILTVAATCRPNKRHLLTDLTDAVSADRNGQPSPALLPSP